MAEIRNSLVYDIYRTCDTIPALVFDKICRTGEYGYLLKSKNLPVYDTNKLLIVWDKITEEYDKISKLHEFKRGYEDRIDLLKEENRLVGIQSACILMRLNQQQAIEDLKYWDVFVDSISIESITKVKNYLIAERTRLTIEYWEEKKYTDLESKARITLLQAMIQAENILGRSIGDKHKITIEEWVYITYEVDKVISYRKKNKNVSTQV